jgi:hypothetical protein
MHMAEREVDLSELMFPVLWMGESFFQVWHCREVAPGFLWEVAGRGSNKGPLIVDSRGRAFRLNGVVALEDDANRSRRRPPSPGVRLICEECGELTVDRVRRAIVGLVSSRGNFESPEDFGLPPRMDAADTIGELLEMLPSMIR